MAADNGRAATNDFRSEPVSDQDQLTYVIRKRERSRFWDVIDPAGELVCVAVYKRGASEVVRRLRG
jgi:hypothetical protein